MSYISGIIICIFGLIFAPSKADFTINSPVLTNYGSWESWKDCSANTFVKAMDILVNPVEVLKPPPASDSQDKNDNEGIIEIGLECIDPYANSSVLGSVISTSANTGFGAPLKSACEGLAIGFQLLSDEPQIALDNTGANNLRLFCSGLKNNPTHYVEGYGDYTGRWTEAQFCKPRQAICGIRIQNDITTGQGDKSGVNNLRFKCCDIPSPAKTCVPSERWEVVQECNNIYGTSAIQCTFLRTVGVGKLVAFGPGGNSLYMDYYRDAALGFSFNSTEGPPYWLFDDLSHTFMDGLGSGSVEGHNWTIPTTETWNVETTTVVSMDVKEGYRSEILQLVGSCGYFSVKTPRFNKLDKRMDEE